ncbi:MAG: hypothetical protein U0271_36745 [Polyangiaceae bacterium]
MDELEVAIVVVAELVRCVQAGARLSDDLHADAQGDIGAVLARELRQRGERLAVDPLHREVEDLVFLTEVDDLDDVRVLDARGDLRLVEEHLFERRIVGEVGQNRLDGDGLREAASPSRAPPKRSPCRPTRSGAGVRSDRAPCRVPTRGCSWTFALNAQPHDRSPPTE